MHLCLSSHQVSLVQEGGRKGGREGGREGGKGREGGREGEIDVPEFTCFHMHATLDLPNGDSNHRRYTYRAEPSGNEYYIP